MKTLRSFVSILLVGHSERYCHRNGGHAWTSRSDPPSCVKCGKTASEGRWW